MIFAVIGGMFLLFGIVGFITIKKIKETDPNNKDTSIKKDIETAQEFMVFNDIKDCVINLGQHQYRAVLKCNSINYSLKTDSEQMIIEATYQRFLNSLPHPISIFIQTKIMDNSKMEKSLLEDINKTIKEFPILEEYGTQFYSDMRNIYTEIGNNKEKNKYIIVPYNDAIALTESSEEEKYEIALKELQTRCQIIKDGLQSIGITATILRTKDLIDLIYTTYHKDNLSQVENITNGEHLSMMVNGRDALAEVSDEGKLDWILYEAQLRLNTELAEDKSINSDLKSRTMNAIDEISKIREALAGEYKQDFNPEKNIKFF